MKLLRCHVDNFGKLSDFEYTFAPGLSVLHAPNGFGKSTLAAFLKAMFYGLPRTGGRDVANNERKKYLPWQGGVYGGTLDFALEGHEYRVRRTFGKTAAGDRFGLYDLTERRDSQRFSANLGEELFALDADSYARTAYVPQEEPGGSFATASIRAKLTNLVHATDDINNCDTALQKLYARRTLYETHRGQGGQVYEREGEVRALDEQLLAAQAQAQKARALDEELAALQTEAAAQNEQLRRVRTQLQAAGAAGLARQKRASEQKLKEYEAQRAALAQAYPAGLPSAEALRAQREECVAAEKLAAAPSAATLSEDERRAYEAGTPLFADEAAAEADAETGQRQCARYVEAQTALRALQLPAEEQQALQSYARRFASGAPTEAELDACAERLRALSGKEGALRAAALGDEERAELAALRAFFAPGELNGAQLRAWDEARTERDRLRRAAADAALPAAEAETLARLGQVFRTRVPSAEEIGAQQERCRRAAALESKPNASAPAQPGAAAPLVLVLGLVLLAAGAALALARQTAAGLALAAAGLALLAVGLVRRARAGQPARHAGGLTETERRERDEAQRAVREFLCAFYPDADAESVEPLLARLLADRSEYLRLTAQQTAAAEAGQAAEAKQAALEAAVRRYWPARPYQDALLDELREKADRYALLTAQERRAAGTARTLRAEAEALRSEIEAFLRPAPGQSAAAALQQLRTACAEYARLQEKDRKNRQRRPQWEHQAAESEQVLRALAQTYALPQEQDFAAQQQTLRVRLYAYRLAAAKVRLAQQTREDAARRCTAQQESLARFLQGYGLAGAPARQLLERAEADVQAAARLDEQCAAERTRLAALEQELAAAQGTAGPAEASEGLEELDREALARQEADAQAQLEQLTERQQTLRAARDAARREADRLPQLQDARDAAQCALAEAEHKRDLLDEAQRFLNEAKDDLATAYAGKVESAFLAAANALLGDTLGRVSLDKDLELRIETGGGERSLASFSAGVQDCVSLCMHLALVDAMFAAEQPCLILDDPFVNLDEEHTARALQMLERAAQTRQVVYLVCNKSRLAAQQ